MTAQIPASTLNALAIDPDNGSRQRLKQLCHSIEAFDQVEQLQDLRSAFQKINSSLKKYDILFISARFSQEEIEHFIEAAKQVTSTEDAAFVLLMKKDDEVAVTENEVILIGGDGVIFEPFSTESLYDICALALKVRKERCERRLAAHLQVTVNDLLIVLDHIAFLQSSNFAITPVLRQFRKLATLVETLPEEQMDIYFNALIARVENPPPPFTFPLRYRYSGKSIRARRRMQRKALSALGYDCSEL